MNVVAHVRIGMCRRPVVKPVRGVFGQVSSDVVTAAHDVNGFDAWRRAGNVRTSVGVAGFGLWSERSEGLFVTNSARGQPVGL